MIAKIPMLVMQGQIINVFDQPETTDKKTGEVRGGQFRIQLMAQNELQNGQSRLDLVNLTVHTPAVYKSLQGQFVRVPVGCFVNGHVVQYYCLKGSTPELIEPATAAS